MQAAELGSYKHFETAMDISKHPIVPVALYVEIEKAREQALAKRKSS
jgi:hypothetical protein